MKVHDVVCARIKSVTLYYSDIIPILSKIQSFRSYYVRINNINMLQLLFNKQKMYRVNITKFK